MMNRFKFALFASFALASCMKPQVSGSETNQQRGAAAQISDAVVTGKQEVEKLFPSRSDFQLFNVRVETVDESVPQAQRRLTTYFITLSKDENKFLPWFHNVTNSGTNTVDTPVIATIIKIDRIGVKDTVTGFRKVIPHPANTDVNLVVFGNWIAEGVQYNPPQDRNPKKEFVIVEPLSKTVRISLDFGSSGRFELSTDQLKRDFSGNAENPRKNFSVNFGSTLIPR
jgi:hypothetical protein